MASALTPQLFAIFSTLIGDACGLCYGPSDRELFGSKLIAHAEERGYDQLLDYYYRLRYDDPDRGELTLLIEALLVHETYFFRELPALVVLADTVLADAVRAHGRARVWSAACSTGEEAYTIAMLLADRGLLDRVEIIATDVSAATIEKARTGRHGKRSLRDGHPDELARRFLDVTAHGVTVNARIRDAVTFSVLNLVDDRSARAAGSAAEGQRGSLDATAHRGLGAFDAIVCRNVLIYFDDAHARQVVDRLASHLAPGGLLAVGVSESLLRFGTSLVCEERGHSFFYRGRT